MKKSILMIMAIVGTFMLCQAQNDTLYIMKTGVASGKYNINNQIDSMMFRQAQNDTLYIMKSGVALGKYNINNQIDSMIFYKPISLKDGEPATVFVEAGEFMMGALGTDPGMNTRETPRHKVTLTKNYKIGKYEVTQHEWEKVMGVTFTPSQTNRGMGPNYPVYDISLNQIMGTSGALIKIDNVTYYEDGFIYKLRVLTGKPYRLPTEAEWEFAARGGKQTHGYLYSGSNNHDAVAWWNPNSTGWTSHEVGKLTPNELGIYDMSGNVHEWVGDLWMNYTANDQVNPICISGTNETYNDNKGGGVVNVRLHRGGSWAGSNSTADDFRVAFRQRLNYAYKSVYNGFRVALDVN